MITQQPSYKHDWNFVCPFISVVVSSSTDALTSSTRSLPSTTQLQPAETSQAPQPTTNPYLSTPHPHTALLSSSQYKPTVSTPKPSEYTTQPVPTKKAFTAFYSSTSHIVSHSAKPELSSVTPTSSANSEHTTMFQTASEPIYTVSTSPKPTNPQTIAGMS